MRKRLNSPLFTIIVVLTFISGVACGRSDQHADGSTQNSASDPVKVGAKVLLENYLTELKKHKVGLVMNPTARVDGVHMLDTLMALNVPVKALFAPEHGFRGEAGAGETIKNGVDQATGLPVYSLYGKTRKPTPGMLKDVDLLLFDMQDVGARFYTYNATLGLVLEAAAENNIPVWVLDRPNPAGGDYVAGWVLKDKYKSFVGRYPIPIAHGLTLGEMANMMVGEGWLDTNKKPDLKVIKMENWKRSMKWSDTGLDWFPPSPNLPRFENAFVYLGTCFFEGTSISEGRGTDNPFLKIGAPDTHLDTSKVQNLAQKYHLDIQLIDFTPKSMPGKSLHPKFEDQMVHGVKISVPTNDYENLDPVQFGLDLLHLMVNATPDVKTNDHLYRLAGTDQIDRIVSGQDVGDISKTWKTDVQLFREARRPYLLYH